MSCKILQHLARNLAETYCQEACQEPCQESYKILENEQTALSRVMPARFDVFPLDISFSRCVSMASLLDSVDLHNQIYESDPYRGRWPV